MALRVPTIEPTALRVGDTWAWCRDNLADFPAPTWTLTYYFRNATAKFDIVATANGAAHAVSVSATASAGKTAGWYDWIAFVGNGTERYQVDSGRIELLPNLALDAVHDGRTFARRMLDSIEAALESRASTDQLDMISAQLDTRGLTRDRLGMITLRDKFTAEVAREERARRGVNSSRILAVG